MWPDDTVAAVRLRAAYVSRRRAQCFITVRSGVDSEFQSQWLSRRFTWRCINLTLVDPRGQRMVLITVVVGALDERA